MSSGDPARLLSDRPMFKLYAAEQHLDNLKSLQAEHGSLVAASVRMQAEMDLDCFLSQVTGAVDSLLVQINERLDLNIPVSQVDFNRVQSELSAKTKNFDLLAGLDAARQYGNWYWTLCELKNHSVHRSFASILVEEGHPARLYLKKNPREQYSVRMDMELIPYLEQSLSRVEQLIDQIRSREPLLRS